MGCTKLGSGSHSAEDCTAALKTPAVVVGFGRSAAGCTGRVADIAAVQDTGRSKRAVAEYNSPAVRRMSAEGLRPERCTKDWKHTWVDPGTGAAGRTGCTAARRSVVLAHTASCSSLGLDSVDIDTGRLAGMTS